jgi:hypothetical protein
MDDAKTFAAFINGIIRRSFYGDSSITLALLKEELFQQSNVSEEEISKMYEYCEGLLKEAALQNLELSELETKLKSTTLTELQQIAFSKLWRINRNRIHEVLRHRSTFNDSLKKLSWRIDIQTKIKNMKEDVNQPVAIVELVLGPNQSSTAEAKAGSRPSLNNDTAIRFEMSRDQVNEVLYHINQIKSLLSSDGTSSSSGNTSEK